MGELNVDLFRSTLEPVKKALEDSGLQKSQIDEILLVGGSTRIPKIQSLIKNFFLGKEPQFKVNPDEAVAYGAAVQAGILSGTGETDALLLDITPLSLGIQTDGAEMSKIIPRNTAIPTKKTMEYHTTGGESTSIIVFEGERPLTKDNHQLGEFEMTDFTRGLKQPHEVTFEVSADGILTVTAKIISTEEEKSLTISNSVGRLTEEEVEKMVEEAEQFAKEDRIVLERVQGRHAFVTYVDSTEEALGDSSGKSQLSQRLTDEDKAKIQDALRDAKMWLDTNPDATLEDTKEKHNEIEEIISPIIKRSQEAGAGTGSDAEEDSEIIDEL